MNKSLLLLLARITRRIWWVKGIDRLLRIIHSPERDKRAGFCGIVPYYDRLMFFIDTSNFLEWNIFFKGFSEPRIVEICKRVMRSGMVGIDIGANDGGITTIMADLVAPAGKVIAVEPNPKAVERLRRNLSINRVTNCVVFQKAVFVQEGGEPPTLLVSSTNNPTGTLSPTVGDVPPPIGEWDKIEVESCTLDDIVTESALDRIDFIKIDTDGSEQNILLGSKNLLIYYKPHIVYEYHQQSWSAHGADYASVYKYLSSLGYSLYRISLSRYMLHLEPLSLNSNLLDADILAVPG